MVVDGFAKFQALNFGISAPEILLGVKSLCLNCETKTLLLGQFEPILANFEPILANFSRF